MTAVLTANAIKSVGTETVCGRVLSHGHGLSLQHFSHRVHREYGMVTDRETSARGDYPGAVLLDHALDIP